MYSSPCNNGFLQLYEQILLKTNHAAHRHLQFILNQGLNQA